MADRRMHKSERRTGMGAQSMRSSRVASARRMDATPSATDELLSLQRLAGNRAVSRLIEARIQRLVDGFYPDGKTKVPASRIALTAAFKKKHVAETEQQARQVTGARIDEGKPAGMVNGTLGNTVAKEADWMAAVDGSSATIPDQDAWSGGLAVKVKGWDAKRVGPRSLRLTALADEPRTVGGYMKKQGGNVEIDHVSGQNS